MKKTTTKRTNSKRAPAKKPVGVMSSKELGFEKGLTDQKFDNGLRDAIMDAGGNPGGAVQLSQAETLEKNTRYYLISNYRQLLSQIYVEHGIIQAVIDIPVDDGMRGGARINTSQLSGEELEELQTYMDENDDVGTYGQGVKWQRLFGGGAVIIITEQDPTEPLDLESLHNTRVKFRAVDMWELYYSRQNTEEFSAKIGDEGYDEEFDFDLDYYDYYGQRIHHSRVIKLKGPEAPSLVRPRLRGWSCSVVETLVRSINQYLKSNDLLFEVLDEFKIDVFSLDGLSDLLLRADGHDILTKRLAIVNFQKNYQKSIALDGKDQYNQKQLSFAGLAEVGQGIRMQIAADLRMPMTKIFGISSAGFSSGQDDIENYNAMVESTIRQRAKYGIAKMVKVRCAQLFGFIPDDLKITFESLRILPADVEQNVKTQKFQRMLQARQAGEISSKSFKEGCNKEQLLSIEVDPNEETVKIDDDKDAKIALDSNGGKKSSTDPKNAPEAKS